MTKHLGMIFVDLSRFSMPEEDFKGIYKPNQYKDVMLPLIVLRRLDLVLEPTKNKVLNKAKALKGTKLKDQGMDSILNRTAKQQFHNKSEFTFEKLKADPDTRPQFIQQTRNDY